MLNAVEWRGDTGNHEQLQQRLRELSAGPHTGVSSAGLCAQQDRENRGARSEQRRQNWYGDLRGTKEARALWRPSRKIESI